MVDHFCSSVFEILPFSGCVVTCMGVQFPAVELDNTVQFATLSRMGLLLSPVYKHLKDIFQT